MTYGKITIAHIINDIKYSFLGSLDMKKIYAIRQIIIAFIAIIFLCWAFFQNACWAKIIITPFIICSVSIIMEKIFFLLNKEKLSNISKYIFRVSFFIYVFGFLTYVCYYAFINKEYSLFIIVAVFIPFTIYFFKKSFFNKNKK